VPAAAPACLPYQPAFYTGRFESLKASGVAKPQLQLLTNITGGQAHAVHAVWHLPQPFFHCALWL
jgi:hypothetical protein